MTCEKCVPRQLPVTSRLSNYTNAKMLRRFALRSFDNQPFAALWAFQLNIPSVSIAQTLTAEQSGRGRSHLSPVLGCINGARYASGSSRRNKDLKELLAGGNVAALSINAVADLVCKRALWSEEYHTIQCALLETATKRIDEASSRSVRKILDSCAMWQICPSKQLIDFISASGHRSAFAAAPPSAISCKDVANSAFALALLHKKALHNSVSVTKPATTLLHRLAFYGTSFLKGHTFPDALVSKFVYGMAVVQFLDSYLAESILQYIQRQSCLECLNPKALSRLVFGLSLMHSNADHYSLEILTRVVLEKVGLGSFSSADIASLLHSAVKMRWRNDDIDRKLSCEACRWMRLEDYDFRTFASVSLSLGRLDHRPPASDIRRCVAYITGCNRIQSLSTPVLSQIALGMHLLDVSDRSMWDAIAQHATQTNRLRLFNSSALSTLLNVFGYRAHDHHVWYQISREIFHGRNLRSFSDRSLVLIVSGLPFHPSPPYSLTKTVFLEIIQRPRIESMSQAHLTLALYSLARINWKHKAFVRPIGQSLAFEIINGSRRHTLLPQTFALTIYALGRAKQFRLVPPTNVAAFVTAALEAGIDRDMTTQNLACTIFGLGELDFSKFALLHRLVTTTLRKKMESFTTIELCNIFFGLGRCRYHRGGEVGTLLTELMREDRLKEMNCCELVTFLFGCSYHGIEDQEIVDTVMARIMQPSRLESFTSKQITTILYALAKLNATNQEEQRKLIRTLLPYDRMAAPVQKTAQKDIACLIYNIALLRCSDAAMKEYVVQILSEGAYEMLSVLKPKQLAQLLTACLELHCEAPALISELRRRTVMTESLDQMNAATWLRVLEAVVRIDKTDIGAIEEVIKRLLKRNRIKDLYSTGMIAVMECLLKTDVMKVSVYSKWILTEWLFYDDGVLVSRLTNAQLMYMISLLKSLARQRYPYLGRLVNALKSEMLSIRRKDSITIDEAQNMIEALIEAEICIPDSLPLTPLPSV